MLSNYNKKLDYISIKNKLFEDKVIDFSHTHLELMKILFLSQFEDISSDDNNDLFNDIRKVIKLKLSCELDCLQFCHFLKVYKLITEGFIIIIIITSIIIIITS